MGILQKLGLRKKSRDFIGWRNSWWNRYPLTPFSSIDDVVEKAYKKNATVYACMFILETMFPEPELWAWERNDRNQYKPIQGHPLRKLMVKPNLDMGEVELFQYTITYAALGGNAYLWKQRDQRKRVKALWPLHDGQITPIPGKSTREGFVAYYVMDDGSNQQTNPWGLDRFDQQPGVAIPKSEMIHWKWMIDPQHPERGMGALEASTGDVKVANELRDYVYSYLKNDATPPIVVKLVEGDEASEAKIKRLKDQWRDSGGGENRGLPRFLEAGMDVEKIASTLKDMQFGELGDRPDTAVCMGFHIHPSVVGTMAGLSSSAYGSNFEEANKALALQTLTPLWRSLASEFHQSLMDEIGYSADETIKFDLGQVRALQASEQEIEERVGSAFDRGGITRAEYRRALGYEVTGADNVFKESLAIVWVPRDRLREENPELIEDEEARQSGENRKRLMAGEDKARAQADNINTLLINIRTGLVGKMREELKHFSGRLADDVVQRAQGKSWQEHETKALPDADDLITPDDAAGLTNLVKRFYVQILQASWDTWNVALGVDIAFDMEDELVTGILGMAGDRVQDITDVTKENLRDVLQYGSEQGWGVDELLRGDPDAGIPGIREIVEETYDKRSRAIARTELGMAQNTGTINRYADAGVEKVLVHDNGFENSDENCVWIAGKVRTLEWTKSDHPGEGPSGIKNPLQHPNCVRAFGPYFGDEE